MVYVLLKLCVQIHVKNWKNTMPNLLKLKCLYREKIIKKEWGANLQRRPLVRLFGISVSEILEKVPPCKFCLVRPVCYTHQDVCINPLTDSVVTNTVEIFYCRDAEIYLRRL